MRTGHAWLLLTVMVGLGLWLSGCASGIPRTPIYADPDLASLHFDTVTVLPVVDRRVDQSSGINLDKTIRGQAIRILEKQGYAVIDPPAFSESVDIPNAEVAEMEVRELTALGPADAKMMLVLYLDDASGVTALGYSFKTEMTALLIDKPRGALIWKDKGIASQGQGGLLGCLMSSSIKSDALKQCVSEMLASFPVGPGKASR